MLMCINAFYIDWFGDYRSLRFLCVRFGGRTFFILAEIRKVTLKEGKIKEVSAEIIKRRNLIMKKIINIIGILSGILSMVFGFICLSNRVGTYVIDKSYGGDAYTGIQNAVADTANNIQTLSENLIFGFGALLIVIGIAILCYFFVKLIEELEKDRVTTSINVNPIVTEKIIEKSEKADNYKPISNNPISQRIICHSCGSENSISNRHCEKCGASLK